MLAAVGCGPSTLPGVNCPGCGEEIAQDARFCPSCGSRIAVHGEERRVVSVVIADVVGFTSIAENRDPEQIKHLVDRCFSWLADDIASYGGRVDKIIGDAVVALFGAPLAHEDDAERAVRAALQMQRTMEERAEEIGGIVQLRIGVNTGEVLVGALHAGGDYTAMGDVVNSADRLQSAAKPGEVLVGDATRQATARVIRYASRGLIRAKGRAAKLQAWRAEMPLTVPGERPRSASDQIVGREAEIGVLASVAQTALAHGRASLLVVLGDAGMGKSRVAREVVEHLTDESAPLVIETRCVPYGEVNAWWPLAEGIRNALDLDANLGFEAIQERLVTVTATTMRLDDDDPTVASLVRGLVQLFGFEETRASRDFSHAQETVVRSVVTFLDATTATRPVVVRISDMHWADQAVLDMLVTVMTRLARRPIVILATARRSMLDRWRPPIGRYDTFALNLEALDAAAADELIDVLLENSENPNLDEKTRVELRERSGGNPLFLVELLTLLDEQVAASPSDSDAEMLADIPDSLRGLIAARLDNLKPGERAIVDDAAVLGRRGLLEHLEEMAKARGAASISAGVAELAARDLLDVDGAAWEFRSDLTREVAYRMLTKSERATKHLGVARWIEQHHQGPWPDGIVDLLVHHYGQAAELLSELGSLGQVGADVRDRALHWIGEVSSRGERLRLLNAVERLCTQGLTLAADDRPEVRLALLLRRARNRVLVRDQAGARDDVAEAKKLATDLNDVSAAAAVMVVEGDLAQITGDLVAAERILAEAVACFEAANDVQGRAEALRALGMAQLFAGHNAEAEHTTNEALGAFQELGSRTGQAWAMQNLAWNAFDQSDIEAAEIRAVESIAIFEELQDATGTSWVQGLLGFIRLQHGDFEAASKLQILAMTEAESSGDRWAEAMMLMLSAGVNLGLGRTEHARDDATAGLALFQEIHDRYGEVRITLALARAMVMRGDASGASDLLRQAESKFSKGAPDRGDALSLRLARVGVEVALGRPDKAMRRLGNNAKAVTKIAESNVPLDDRVRQVSEIAFVEELLPMLALIRLQQGAPGEAQGLLEVAEKLPHVLQSGLRIATIQALHAVASQRFDQAIAQARLIVDNLHYSYLDRAFGLVVIGLAATGAQQNALARAAFAQAHEVADPTGDLLMRALVRLGEGVALQSLHDPVGEQTTNHALMRLGTLGTDAEGWLTLFGLGLAGPANDE